MPTPSPFLPKLPPSVEQGWREFLRRLGIPDDFEGDEFHRNNPINVIGKRSADALAGDVKGLEDLLKLRDFEGDDIRRQQLEQFQRASRALEGDIPMNDLAAPKSIESDEFYRRQQELLNPPMMPPDFAPEAGNVVTAVKEPAKGVRIITADDLVDFFGNIVQPEFRERFRDLLAELNAGGFRGHVEVDTREFPTDALERLYALRAIADELLGHRGGTPSEINEIVMLKEQANEFLNDPNYRGFFLPPFARGGIGTRNDYTFGKVDESGANPTNAANIQKFAKELNLPSSDPNRGLVGRRFDEQMALHEIIHALTNRAGERGNPMIRRNVEQGIGTGLTSSALHDYVDRQNPLAAKIDAISERMLPTLLKRAGAKAQKLSYAPSEVMTELLARYLTGNPDFGVNQSRVAAVDEALQDVYRRLGNAASQSGVVRGYNLLRNNPEAFASELFEMLASRDANRVPTAQPVRDFYDLWGMLPSNVRY